MQSIALAFIHLLQNWLKHINSYWNAHYTKTHKVIYSQFVDWCFVYLDQCLILSRPSINFFFLNKSIKYTGKYNLVCGTPIIFLRKLIKMRRRNLKKNQGKMRFELIDKWRERDSESMAEVSVEKIWWRMAKSYLWSEIYLRVRRKLSFKHKLSGTKRSFREEYILQSQVVRSI